MIVEKLGRTLVAELPIDIDSGQPAWVRMRQCKKWPLSRALDVAAQLATALAYCHDEALAGYRVMHRDVKPPNIGFKPDGQLVLFDFGLATLWARDEAQPDDVTPRQLTGETGSLRYMAPEVANWQPYNHKAEVFSFATVVWEMATHRRPFESFTPEIFRSALGKGMTPPIPMRWDARMRALLASCWHLSHDQRPEFRELVPRLVELREKELANEAQRSNFQMWMRAVYP
jgi:serine/threonine protein kinase